MIGERFNRWVVVSVGEDYIYPRSKNVSKRFNCRCDCGSVKLIHSAHLKNGSSQSCGCLNREVSSTHGMSNTRAYKSWANMVRRCSGKGNNRDKCYTDKGISFQPSWVDFEAFYKDMGDCPKGFELERTDSKGNYCAENCVWADEITQATNRSKFINNTSGHTGVTWSKVHGKWRVGIHVNKIRYEGGLYKDLDNAVARRKELELKYLGYTKENNEL